MIMDYLKKIISSLISDTYSISLSGETEPVLTFDSIEECAYSGSATVTSYPVEAGYRVTEYKYENPSIIEMKASISTTGDIGGFGISFSLFGKNKSSMVSTVRSRLEQFKKELVSLDIQTRTANRYGYTLTDYNIPENYDNYNMFEVSMTFEKIMTVENANPNIKDMFQADTSSTGISQVIAME